MWDPGYLGCYCHTHNEFQCYLGITEALGSITHLHPTRVTALSYVNTHVRKWGWFFTVSSSFSKNVVSVASPGLRHSSSYKHTHSSIDFLLCLSAHRPALILSHWNTAPVWPFGLLTSRPALSSTNEESLSWEGERFPPSRLPGLEASFPRADGGDTIRLLMVSLFSVS